MKLVCWIFLLISPLSSFADSQSCQAIFADSKMDKAAVRELILQHYQMDEVSILENLILKYSARKIWNSKISSDNQFNQNLVKIDGLIRFGIRVAHGETSENSSLESQWVNRAILNANLGQLLSGFGYETSYSESTIKKIVNNKALRFLLDPSRLPGMADRPIPEEMIQKILQDGLAAHEKELQALFHASGQDGVATYRRFTFGYRIVATAVMAYLLWQQYENFQLQLNSSHKEKLNQSLDNMDDLAETLDQEFAKRGLYKK